jgi:sporulation protein YlmC with PRC-barrel domain
MIRRLMASSALVALMSAGALSVAQAQTDNNQQPVVQQDAAATAGATAGESTATLTPDQPTLATAFIGRTVYSGEGDNADNIGEVNDLIVSDDGTITHAVVGVGGFLGIGEKNVAVPFDELKVQEQEGDIRLIYAATKEQLEAAPQFDRTAYDPRARAAEQQAAADSSQPLAPAAGTGVATDPAATAAAPAASTDTAANSTTSTAATPATDMAANSTMGEAGFMSFEPDQVRASTLIGKEVRGPDDQSIGEVADLVLQEDGKTRAALIDVGGFLGIGEKRVAIPFTEIQITAEQQDTAAMGTAATGTTATGTAATGTDTAATGTAATGTDTAANGTAATGTATTTGNDAAVTAEANADRNANIRLVVSMTKEQLEQAPEWKDPNDQANQQASNAGQPATGADNANNAATTANQSAANGATTTDQSAIVSPDMAANNTGGTAGTAASDGAAFQTATQDLRAEELMGQSVYSSDDKSLGEIDDLVLNKDGAIQAVVIDVGGFLGIGEKPVAVQFDALNVQKNEGGDLRLMVNASQQQLESAPSYDDQPNAAQ